MVILIQAEEPHKRLSGTLDAISLDVFLVLSCFVYGHYKQCYCYQSFIQFALLQRFKHKEQLEVILYGDISPVSSISIYINNRLKQNICLLCMIS